MDLGDEAEIERRAVQEARLSASLGADALACERCGAVWRADAVREATQRQPICPVCGSGLTPAAAH
jgi:hypothetical protein